MIRRINKRKIIFIAILFIIITSFMACCHKNNLRKNTYHRKDTKKEEFVQKDTKEKKDSKSDIPTDLKVELLENPYGINSLNPSFSWYMPSNKNNVLQTAYHIVISNSYKNMKEKKYIYDSGWRDSSNSTSVKLDKLRLESNQLYYWKVQTCDEEKKKSSFSKYATFSTSVGREWASTDSIWAPKKNDFAFLRTNFVINEEKKVDKAILSITAASPEKTRQYVYNVYLNGKLVGLGPSRQNKHLINYNTYDVTSYLNKDGENVIGAINYTASEKKFLCQLTLFLKNGTKRIVLNSGRDKDKWSSLDADAIYGKDVTSIATPYYVASGENIDGARFPFGWNKKNFDDSNWSKVSKTGSFVEQNLVAYISKNMTRFKIYPKKIINRGNGHYFVDFGREIIGGISLTINNSSFFSRQVTIRSGEELDDNGDVLYKMRTGNTYEECWKFGTGKQNLENIGMKTFRYVDIYNCPDDLTASNIHALAIRQEFNDKESSFHSSDKLLNDIYDMTKYTIKATNQNLYVDSQSRERGVYEGDCLINAAASYAVNKDYTLARFSNEYLYDNPSWPAEYLLYSIICSWNDYLYTGNIDSIEKNYEKLKNKLFLKLLDKDKNLIHSPSMKLGEQKSVLVDWPETEQDGFLYDSAYYNTVFNSIHYGALVHMGQLAHSIGKFDDEKYYLNVAQELKKSMISKLYNESKGAFSDGLDKNGKALKHYSQHATAFALTYGVYRNSKMADKMAAYLKKDRRIKMSVYGAYFLLDGLYSTDNGAYATELMTEKDTEVGARTWAYMLKKSNATITTEAWNIKNKDNMTFSHPWGAAPANLIATGIFGIRPTTPGFSTFQIKFQPGNIKKASISVPSSIGNICAEYKSKSYNQLISARVKIPPNAKAKVYLPSEKKVKFVSVNEKEIRVIYKNGYAIVNLGSGTYNLTM